MSGNYIVTYKFYCKCLALFGIWVKENTKVPMWHKIYSIFVFTFVALHNIAMTAQFVRSFTSFKAIASTGYIVVACITSEIKLLLVLYNRKYLLNLVKLFYQVHFIPRNKKEDDMVTKELSYFKISSYVLLTISYSSVIFVVILPYFWDINDGLPMSAWYPFNYSISPIYETIYIHQAIGTFCNCGLYNLVDILLSGSLIFVGLQCRILCERVKKIGQVESEDAAVLADCIEHQRSILRFLKGIEKLFGVIYFWQLISSTTTLCMNLFLISLTNPLSFEFIYLILYQVAIGNLLLVPCWFASQMTAKSEAIPFAIYSSDWTESSNSFKKDLSFFICISQKPLKLYAVNFFEISVVTFVSIYRAALGYFAVLNNMHNRETDNS